MIKGSSGAIPALSGTGVGGDTPGQGCIIGRDLLPRAGIEPAGDPIHLRVAPGTRGEMLELAQGIALVETGKARREVPVTLTARTVAGRTGAGGPGRGATKRDRLPGRLEWIGGIRRRRTAGQDERGKRERGESKRGKGEAGHLWCLQPRRRIAGSTPRAVVTIAVLAAMTAACKPPPSARHDFDPAAAERGRAVVVAAGCAACHAFPDIAWPKGRAGPDLTHFDGLGPIAGALPNTPANLAAFVRNAPAAKPGSAMPAMPITQSEARDVAAYLYGISDD
nr:c-type cytochrome [uncultured Sphingomonas sp.]